MRLLSQKYEKNHSSEDSVVYFYKAGIVGCHSNSSVRYNKVKFDTTAVERGSLIQGPYTPTTTSKPLWNQALLVICSPWRVTRVTSIFHTHDHMNRPDNTTLNFQHDKFTADISPLIKRNHTFCSAFASGCHLCLLQLCQPNISHPTSVYNKQIYLA